MPSTLTKLRRQPVWLALIIVVLLCVWLASGLVKEPKAIKSPAKNQPSALVKVTVERVQAEEVTREITLYGRTEPDRVATLRSEVKGLVKQIHVQRGQQVSQGQKIVSLEKTDYVSRLQSAKATLKQREAELKAAQALQDKGYQSQTALAQAQAKLEMAKADVMTYELAVYKSDVIAPFDGVVNQRFVEVGDLLKDGDKIATLVDLDPLVISANVTEGNIQKVLNDQAAIGRMVTGERLEGKVRYISSISEPGTNTFKVEVAVPNPDYALMAGMSTELALPLKKTWAIRITPAVMALDEQGNLGVKTVVDQHVNFIPIDIVKSDSQGVWLSGMGQQADIITLGHGFVRDGDRVEVVRADSNSAENSSLSLKSNNE